MSKTKSNPLGPGTVNVTVNMDKQLAAQVGRAAFELGAKSKGQFVRVAIREHLKRVAEESAAVALVLLFLVGAVVVSASGVMVSASGVMGDDQSRRMSGGAVSVPSARRNLNKKWDFIV